MVLNKPLKIDSMWINPLNVASISEASIIDPPILSSHMLTCGTPLPIETRLDFLRPRRDMLFPLLRWPTGPGGPRGERGCVRSLGRYGDGKGWMRNGSLLQAQWPERVILFLSALQLHLYLILTGLYPRAQVRSFTYTTRHVSHPQPHAQYKPCKRHSLTPAYRLTPTSEGLLFLYCMHAFWCITLCVLGVGNTTKILFHYMRNFKSW